MLRLIIPEQEWFDEATETIGSNPEVVLELEHSLSSLSKWEEEWAIPFLDSKEKTPAQIQSYVYHMQKFPGGDFAVLNRLTVDDYTKINDYIAAPHTATTFGEMPKKTGRGETITAELIYYWMVAFGIPFECENWHLNRLFALIRICNIKNQPQKKLSKHEIAQRNRELNAQRKEQLGTRG